MKKLDRIKITNYKSIRNLYLELSALNVFIGANGSGKSNFIGVFKFLNHLIEGNLQTYTAERGGADTILHFGRKKSEEMSFNLSFENGVNGYLCRLAAGAEDNFFFKGETVWFHSKPHYPHPLTESLGSGHLESKISQIKTKGCSRIALHVLRHLESWRLYHFHDTSDSAKVKQTGDLEDNRFLKPDARNLAAFLYRLEKNYKDHFDNIQDAIRLVAPFFDRFNLQPSELNPDKIRLEWREKGSDAYFNASVLSDGTLRFICMATLLLQPQLPSVILVDEPELGLHPSAISVLANLLQSAAKRTQVLISTQSVTLVNHFEPQDVVVVEREEGQSVFRRLDKADMTNWLDDYSLGDLWEKNVIGGRP
jgi:predicted ATPase